MDFCRTRDLEHVYKVLTCPTIYQLMGDDYLPDPEQFIVNDHPDIHYLIAGRYGLVGMFCLFPQNRICWELHAALLPFATKEEKREAGRGLVPWLRENTDCQRLTASVPACNWPAIIYGTHAIGMKYVGRQERAFMKNGKLHDLVILGRSVKEELGPLRRPQRLSTARPVYAEKRTTETVISCDALRAT